MQFIDNWIYSSDMPPQAYTPFSTHVHFETFPSIDILLLVSMQHMDGIYKIKDLNF
jgi:hypothetical protein